jgi:hypothetical protein
LQDHVVASSCSLNIKQQIYICLIKPIKHKYKKVKRMKKLQNYPSLFFIVNLVLALIPNYSTAQKKTSIDNGYYITYQDKLILRIYLSQKYAPFTISASGNDKDLNYKTNSKLSLGIGGTYQDITLNAAYGFSFLNKDKGRGKTTGLDVQLHVYPNKWAIDLLGTFRKGYYLDPKDNNGLNLLTYYKRPDLKRDVVGVAVFRVPNGDKFSYKAALTQKEWQTKSAGSLLYGGQAYYGAIKGDSSFVPDAVRNNFPQKDVDKINFFSIGPGIGYAYTLVISKNFYISASVIGIIDVNFSTEHQTGNKHKKVSVLPGGVYKGAIGYNSDKWSIAANITGDALYAGSASSSKEYFVPTGNVRLILARKIGLKTHH